jgi:hypothetical protein
VTRRSVPLNGVVSDVVRTQSGDRSAFTTDGAKTAMKPLSATDVTRRMHSSNVRANRKRQRTGSRLGACA